jgi:hypothetical protein
MIDEQEILSFQKKLEERNFVLDDRLLEQLVESKLRRLQKQFEDNTELRRLTKQRR